MASVLILSTINTNKKLVEARLQQGVLRFEVLK